MRKKFRARVATIREDASSRRPGSTVVTKKQDQDKNSSNVIRSFICLEIPESIQSRIKNLQENLRQTESQISWTRPSNIHLTLKFLGGVELPRIESVGEALERAANGIGPFEVEVGGAGCFPTPRNPRVLWVGISDIPKQLQQLYDNVEDELGRQDFPREQKRFMPHLTIGRIRAPLNSVRVAEALIASGFESESFTAEQVILMRSDLKPTGSIYTPQTVVRLS